MAEVCELMSVPTSELELRALMVSALDGDAAAHRALLENLSGRLRGYFKGQLSRIGRGPVEAEDLVQEALMAIHTRRHTYDPAQLFTPWVYAIARYKFVDYLRREKASLRDLPIEDTKEMTSSDTSGQVESSLDLERLMAGLAPRVRQAIQAVKLDGLSVSEAAAQSGMSESNVKVTIHRGLKAMARLIREKRS
jgi:RNA polymerase sigma-70 factor (ECF subfamily)